MRTPPNPALAEALGAVRERLDDDSDAFADEDLLRRLYEATLEQIDGGAQSVRGRIVEMLRVTTIAGAQLATSLTGDDVPPVVERVAAVQMLADLGRATRDLLEAHGLAPHDDAAFMPDDERAAAAAQVKDIHGALTSAEHRASHLADFLDKLAGEFEQAGSHVSLRVAGRIRDELAFRPEQ